MHLRGRPLQMGLGKSLQAIMLMLANPATADWSGSLHEPHDVTNPCKIKTTLLVMPANLLAQWRAEISKHTAPGALKVGSQEVLLLGTGASHATWLYTTCDCCKCHQQALRTVYSMLPTLCAHCLLQVGQYDSALCKRRREEYRYQQCLAPVMCRGDGRKVGARPG